MKAEASAGEALFASVSERLLDEEGVEQGRMLQATGLRVGGKFFAFATKGDVVVKLPAGRVSELIATGAGEPCNPRGGTPMREWVRLSPADEAACAAYVLEARDFVARRSAGS